MSEEPSFDASSVVGRLTVSIIFVAVFRDLLPAFLVRVWQILPALLILWLIVGVLGRVITRLIE